VLICARDGAVVQDRGRRVVAQLAVFHVLRDGIPGPLLVDLHLRLGTAQMGGAASVNGAESSSPGTRSGVHAAARCFRPATYPFGISTTIGTMCLLSSC